MSLYFFFYLNIPDFNINTIFKNVVSVDVASYTDTFTNISLNGILVEFNNSSISDIIKQINSISEYISIEKIDNYKLEKITVQKNNDLINDVYMIIPNA